MTPLSSEQAFRAELEATFAAEADERIATMNSCLLELERGVTGKARSEAIGSLLRDVHSLKGGSQLLGWSSMAALAHALESRLTDTRHQPTTEHLDTAPLFSAVDLLTGLKGAVPPPADFEATIAWVEGRGPQPAEAPPDRPPEPAGSHRRDPAPDAVRRPPVQAAELWPPDDPGATAAPPEAAPEVTPEAPPEVPPKVPPVEHPADPQRAGAAVRVSTERLDALIERSADLIALREGRERRRSEMRSLLREVDDWRRSWRPATSAAAVMLRRPEDRSPTVAGLLAALTTGGERLEHLSARLRELARESTSESMRLGQVLSTLEADLLALRLVPVRTLFRQFPRMVRDLAAASGKQVRVVEAGWDTPMDRDLLERLKDPVMHILRNAVDHGLERPADRLAAGKPAEGVVTLDASPHAGGVRVTIRDDGRGVDLDRVEATARGLGLLDRTGTGGQLLDTIFEPGLSTAERVTDVSGRGVGLDVVRQQVHALGGTVRVESQSGVGTSFVLQLPLTLVSLRVLVVRVDDRRYGLPVSAVQRIVRIANHPAVEIAGRRGLRIGDSSVIISDLSAVIGSGTRGRPAGRALAVVLGTGPGRVAVGVDGVDSPRDVVIKDLGALVGTAPLVAGAALVEDESVLLVLDAAAVGARALADDVAGSVLPLRDAGEPARTVHRTPRILLVDDSITTRTLEKNILAAAGFDVVLAADGEEALRALRLEEIDLVVSDVDMPRLNGLELTERIRADAATRELPVVLMTAKDRPEEQDQGLRAGASAYLLKGTFDQHALLSVIRELIG